MALDDATTQFLSRMAELGGPPLNQLRPEQARAGGPMVAAMFATGPDMFRVDEVTLPAGADGGFRVRTLVPVERPQGVLVYYHGGGWVVGSIDEYDSLGRHLAASTGFAVVMVDYRKAPEHPYPAPVEDAWQALVWVEENLTAIAGRTVPIVVGGDSAGGNLAAVVSRLARYRSGPAIALQVLVYPVVDADLDTPSYLDPANQLALTRDSMIWFWDHYAAESIRGSEDLSPLRAADLTGLPPAVVVLAEHDVLRSEGEAYADALAAAGVPVRRRLFAGQMHGFLHMVGLLPGSAAAISYLAEEIRQLPASAGAGRASEVDALVVGAGFAGLYQLYRLRKLGLRTRVVEKGAGVGGTWFWNRYPGARCDIPSLFYTVSYAPELNEEWHWPERFSTHDEIRAYMEEIARREDMYRDISFETVLVAAEWDDEAAVWTSTTDSGERITSRYLIMATGALSESRVPDVPGLDGFQGRWFHTGRWPHEPVDVTGRRVALIGTGSTGVQVLPVIADAAESVTVFQRMPKFVLPAVNVAMTEEDARPVKDAYPILRDAARRGDYGTPFPKPAEHLDEMPIADREELLEGLWVEGGVGGFVVFYDDYLGLKNEKVNDIVADFVRRKIRQIVEDPEVAETLTPYGYPIGINRIIIGTDFYETFNRDDVTLHSVLADPIVEITTTGLRTEHHEFEFDDIVFATGYDGLTGSFTAVDIRNRSGVSIKGYWDDGPSTYLGMQMHDFPNLFLITGPGGPSVLANVITTTEQSIEFITGLIEHAESTGVTAIEPDPESEATWMEHVGEVANGSLYRYAYKSNSWYTGSNVPGKKIVFMPYAGGVGTFQDILDDVTKDGYRGFRFSGEPGLVADSTRPQVLASRQV